MKQIHKIVNIVLAIVIIILCIKGCDIQKDRDNLLTQMATYQLNEKAFKTKILKDSSTMATQTQTILTQEEATKLGLLKLEGEIKKVQSQVRETQTIKINSVEVPFIPNGYADTTEWVKRLHNGDTSKSVCDSFIANSVIVPNNFALDDKWYSINGKVQKKGLLIDSLKINNESSVTIGYRNTGFLNLKKEPIVEIKNTNPYLSVTKMNNVVVKDKFSILHSKLFWFAVGIAGGIYLHTKM
jgi:hypothetical protein